MVLAQRSGCVGNNDEDIVKVSAVIGFEIFWVNSKDENVYG